MSAWFSPTEAASVGACGAFVLGLINRKTPRQLLGTSLIDTVKTTAMIFTVLIGAILFNNFLILASVPTLVSDWISGLPLGKTAILLVIVGMYFVLGCLLDLLAMILLTIPIVFPIVKALGYDPVWFGIIIVMVVELGLITPPIGMNVFVIKGMAKDVPLEDYFPRRDAFHHCADHPYLASSSRFRRSRSGCRRRRSNAPSYAVAIDRLPVPKLCGRYFCHGSPAGIWCPRGCAPWSNRRWIRRAAPDRSRAAARDSSSR